MANQVHHINCNQIHDRESGVSDNCRNLIHRYNIIIPFKLSCVGCCFEYLRTRNYQAVTGAAYDRVCFASPDALLDNFPVGNLVNAFVKLSNISDKGQIATGFDYNSGERVVRTVSNFRTYQIYSSNPGQRQLSVGIVAKARMESIAIGSVRPKELVKIYYNYADAALVELYRDRRNPSMSSLSGPSVTGYLFLRDPQPPPN